LLAPRIGGKPVLRTQELLYGENVNVGLLRLLGRAEGRVLDLGSGSGAMAPALRCIGATTVVGVDSSEAACAVAAPAYDALMTATIEEIELPSIGGETFDIVVIADVLEHLVDPWAALDKVRGWMAPRGRVAISTPNLSHIRMIASLVLRDDFSYSPAGGVMDETHLRWFTRSTMDAALERTGFSPEGHGGTWGPRRAQLGRLTRGRLDRFLLPQIHVVARVA
jgi:2-polyprenyl-3-methyl-5-hydroxy-6-metoxy-1,4-benzoquinol methylase